MQTSGTARAGRRRLLASVLTAVPFVALAGSVALILAAGGDEDRLRVAYLLSFVVLEVVGFATSLYAGLRRGETRPVRRIFLLLAFSFVTMVVFGAAFGAAADGGTPPAVATAVMLLSRAAQIAALLGALLSFPTRSRSPRDRAKLGFELATAAGGGFMLVWYFVVGPALASPSVALTTLLFPVGDLVMLTGVLAVMLRGVTRTMRRPLVLLLVGLVLFFGSDIYSSHQAVYHPGYVVHPALTILVLAGMASLVAAAGTHCRRPAGSAAPESGPAPEPTTNRLPYIALAVGYGVLALAAVRAGLYPWLGLVAGAAVMTGGIAARQIIALRENHELAVTDGLTGLANRAQVHARLRRAVERSRRAGDHVAVLLIDLDGFKQVNDGHGHEAGDRLLAEFAAVLGRSVRRSDLAGRLGGDEFAVVLERTTRADAIGVADRVLAAAAASPVLIAGREVRATASIGIAVAPAAGTDPDELLHRADLAMYQAKRSGRHGWELYAEDPEPVPVLERDLPAAIGSGQLRVVYQPIVALDTGQFTAVEALVRWDHPTLGPIGPQEFIPLAESTGQIHELGAWVLERACREVGAWQRRLPAGRALHLSVNVSAHELARESLAADVAAVLARTGFAPTDLVLELTEGVSADNEAALRQLAALRATGIRIALDDFGTGYSSLRYLTRLPVDILKLDRCFVAELDGRPEGAAIAEAVVRLGRLMRLETVAEGIEDPAQVSELRRLGYGTGQGFHFAHPLEPAQVEALLDEGTRAGWPHLAGLERAGAAA